MAKKSPQKTPVKKKNRLSAEAALTRLKDGNKRFLGHDPINYPTQNERSDFQNGQKPYAAILSCADSRVSPEIMFNAGLDELFVIRVAGNIADTTSIASIEYAVAHLNTSDVYKRQVDAALANSDKSMDLGYNLNHLVAHITPAVAAAEKKKPTQSERLSATVKENAKLNAKELRSRSRIISQARGVQIVWAYYHLTTGKVDFSNFL